MADTIKDYLVGFGFDVDEGGSDKIEEMLANLDSMVRNLGEVLNQAIGQMQGFVDGLGAQADAASAAAEGTESVSEAAETASEGFQRASETAREAGESMSETADTTTDISEKLTDALEMIQKAVKAVAGWEITQKLWEYAQSFYHLDREIEETAKSMNKTNEQARAHLNALSAMGKTYEEIQKDENLKATYDDLVALGESFALPDAEEGIQRVDDMVESFQRLKMIGSYAMQWLYHSVLEVAQVPLMRFKEAIDDIAQLVQRKAPAWTAFGADLIEDIMRIVSAFGKAAVDIVKFLDKIPGPIKVILGLIGALALLLKMGPLARVIALLTVIGLLLDDFYTYLEGGETLLGPFWEKAVDAFNRVETAISSVVDTFKSLWKSSHNENGEMDWRLFGENIGNWIAGGIEKILGDFGTLVKKWLTGDENAGWDDVGSAIVSALSNGVQKALDAADNLVGFIMGMINGAITPERVSGLLTNAGEFVEGILQAITDEIPKVGESAKKVVNTIMTGIAGLLNTITSDDVSGSLGTLATNFITGAFNAMGAALQAGGAIVADVVKYVGPFVNNLFNAITNIFTPENIHAVAGSIKGFVSSIYKALGDAIGGALDSVGEIDGINLGEGAANILTNILDTIFNTAEDLSADPSVTGFVEKLGAGLSHALQTLGEIVGSFAGQFVKWLFTTDSIQAIYHAGENFVKIFLEGLGAMFTGLGDLIFGMVVGALDALGIVDANEVHEAQAAYTAAENTAKVYKDAFRDSFKETMGFEEDDSEAIDAAREDYAKAFVSSLFMSGADDIGEDLKYNFVNFLGENNETLAELGYKDAYSRFLDQRDRMWEGLSSVASANAGHRTSVDIGELSDFYSFMGLDAEHWNREKFGEYSEQFFDDMIAGWEDGFTGADVKAFMAPFLDQYGIAADYFSDEVYDMIAQSVTEGGLDNNNDLMGMIFGSVFEFDPADAEEQAEAAADPAIEAARELGIDVAEDENEAFQEGYESVDREMGSVTGGMEVASGQGVEGMAQTLTAGKGAVETAAAEVSDAAVQQFLLTMNYENGASIAQSFIDGMKDKLNEIVSYVQTVVNAIASRLRTIPSRSGNVFSSVASSAKSALGSLPEWIQTNVVNKINTALSNIRMPNINMPNLPGNSEGGRIDRETVTRVGEGNKREYIIPVTKPNRALPLIQQAAADLGLTVQSFANATRMLGGSPTANVTPAYAAGGGASASHTTVNNNNQSVNVPTTINVYSSDPKQTSSLVEHNQEQLLMRNIKPMLA